MDIVAGAASLATLIGVTITIGITTTNLVHNVRDAPKELHAIGFKLSALRSNLEQLRQIGEGLGYDDERILSEHFRQSIALSLHATVCAIGNVRRAFQPFEKGTSLQKRIRWALLVRSRVEKLLRELDSSQVGLCLALQILELRVALLANESMVVLHDSQGLLLTQVGNIEAIVENNRFAPCSHIQTIPYNCPLMPKSLLFCSSPAYTRPPTVLGSYSWLMAGGLSGTIASSCTDSGSSYSVTLRMLLPWFIGGRAMTFEALIRCYTARLFCIRLSRGSLTMSNVVRDDARIMDACEQGDLQTAQSLFQSRQASPNDITSAGRTPLLFAIKGGHPKIVALLLGLGADVNASYGDFQMSPLQLAVQLDYLEICRILLGGGASADHTDARGWTAAFYLWPRRGLRRPSRNTYLTLLDSVGTCDFAITGLGGSSALHQASSFGTSDDVATLVKFGAAAHSCTESMKISPLHYALLHQNEATIGELLKPQYQINVNATDSRGWTPLHFASWHGTEWLLIALFILGADPHCLTKPAFAHVPKCLQNRKFTPMQAAEERGSEFLEAYLSALRQSKIKVSVDDIGDVYWDAVE